MPAKAPHICSCGAVVQVGRGCPTCTPARRRVGDAQRPSARQRGYDTRWDKARAGYLGKHPLCVMCEREGATVLATLVDHIEPHRNDMARFWDSSNWQALCREHHSGAKQSMEKRAPSSSSLGVAKATVHLVCGPPASGKTSYVHASRKYGDLVIDLDAIYAAISGEPWYTKPDALLPFVLEARDAMIRRLEHATSVRTAWIIMGGARVSDRNRVALPLSARVMVLATPPSTCMRRIINDPRRSEGADLWKPIVDKWWSDYQPNDGDVVVSAFGRTGEGGGSELDPAPAGPTGPSTRETPRV